MDMTTDDEIYKVDDTYLGPPGQTLLWAARYRAYGIGAVLFGTIIAGESATGLLSPWGAIYGLLVTIGITMWVMEKVDHEMTVRALAVTFFHEVRAPRGRRTTGSRGRHTLTEVRRR